MLKKIIFITGANSFLAQSAAEILSKRGYLIYGCCRNPDLITKHSNFKKILPYTTLNLPLSLIPKGINVLLHFEGHSSVLKSFAYSETLRSYNLQIIKKIEKIAIQSSEGLHIIFPSSAAVYGQKKNSNLEENSELKPISPYGINKANFENSLRTFCVNNSIQCSIVRFFSLYGPTQKKQLIWEAYKKLKFDETSIFHGTGNEVRDFFYITDAINLIDCLIKRDDKLTIINGGTGIKTTVSEVVNKIKFLIKSDKEIIFNGKNRIGDPFSLLASTLLFDKIAFKPKIFLSEGLNKTVLYYESN